MIWYDVVTKQPVAPGGCEDGGIPSIDAYKCSRCLLDEKPLFHNTTVKNELQIDIIVGVGRCRRCFKVMLTTLL